MNQAKERIPVLIEDRISGMEDKVEGLDQISKEFEKKFKITGNVGTYRKCEPPWKALNL